jgi:hypothetical protein
MGPAARVAANALSWLLLLALLPLAALPSAAAEREPLFRIGTADGSAREFALGPDGFAAFPQRFPNGADFTVGTSDPATDWP